MPLDQQTVRNQFPALQRQQAGETVIYTDGPAGSQVPQCVVQAITDYLLHHNANHGGSFVTSRESDALLEQVHSHAAAFFGIDDPDCVIFSNNMTTLTFAMSRAISQTWKSGDEIVLSRCDHDANVTPWAMAAAERGVMVRWIDVNPGTCTLSLESLQQVLSPRTRLVAVGVASNAVGTVHPVRTITEMAHRVGALVYLDAVHSAAHAVIDAPAMGADFIACSAYKFFGPHVGLLWARRELLESLTPYKVRPSTNELPGRWMTGTQNHEGLAGVKACIDYLASLSSGTGSLRERLVAAYALIGEQEHVLGQAFITGLQRLPRYRLWGKPKMEGRVSTFGITHASRSPADLSERLAQRGIFTWAGNFYALPLTEALGLEPTGMLRIGFLHYNTLEEVERVLAALAELH